MEQKINLENIHIVLNRPRFPENIGSAVRAMRNMGLNKLIVVDPENYDIEKIMRLATHDSAEMVEQIKRYDNLESAVSSMSYVVGTTARLGGERQSVQKPADLADRLVSITADNPVAIVFGPEDRGLTNEEIRRCHVLINIPTADFSSINLAQSVMIICYEIFQASRKNKSPFSPRLASRHELDGMYDQLKDILVRIDYILPENPDYWMNKLRRFFSRIPLRAREVSIIRGICRQVNWYGKKCYVDGKNDNSPDPALDISD
ncbi:MAG: RNA methyltransferase [Desulfobacteraceae bacterium]|nr:RNA methyltransferase [Desulfobacteraceae bacterium]